MKKLLFLILIGFGFLPRILIAQLKTENVILIALDGCRWQDAFTGADSVLIRNREQTKDTAAFLKKYWRNSPQERRKVLMPFMWNTIATGGQLYGNRLYGNNMNLTNKMWFSYPGFSEILCGFADDERINSNSLIPNPNKNVLEFLNGIPAFKGKVAAFSSWDAFPYIINEERSGVYVNGAFEPVTGQKLTESEILMNKLMRKVPEFIGGVRNDAFTFYQAFEYLKKNKPKVLFIALDETDDLSHMGRYDLYLNAMNYSDQMIEELWNWVQSTPGYKNKTTMIITIDHGRGVGPVEWKSHGIKIPHADETWFAVIGPDTPAKGELKTPEQYYTNQLAASIAALLGQSYSNQKPVGETINSIFSK